MLWYSRCQRHSTRDKRVLTAIDGGFCHLEYPAGERLDVGANRGLDAGLRCGLWRLVWNKLYVGLVHWLG